MKELTKSPFPKPLKSHFKIPEVEKEEEVKNFKNTFLC